MGEATGIAWCDHTFNPWWGCTRVSPGCDHCYAEAFDKRVGGANWGPAAPRRFFGDAHWREPVKWNRKAREAGARRRVFCASMADVFEPREDLRADRVRLFHLIEDTPNLYWLLLTKRPESATALASLAGWNARWPENVMALTTAENQAWADKRIPELLKIPAAAFGVSYEPALGPVEWDADWMYPRCDQCGRHSSRGMMSCGHAVCGFTDCTATWRSQQPLLDWLIVGGESGPGARPFDVAWARSTVKACREAGVACFYKQGGAANRCAHSAKGGCFDCFPSDLQVREFPGAVQRS